MSPRARDLGGTHLGHAISTTGAVHRQGQCQCKRVTVHCVGDPVGVSVCHCFDCQKRSGSAFAVQARFAQSQVEIIGPLQRYVRVSDSGNEIPQYFCPFCGTGIYYQSPDQPDLLALAIGLFSDLEFPPPHNSVWEKRKHPWVEIVAPSVRHRAD